MSSPRKVLIVSPAFPPANAADMHRVRMSLPYWKRFGWSPIVLCISAKDSGYPIDPLLSQTVAPDVAVVEVTPISLAVTRRVGITNLGLRSFRALLKKGREIVRREKIDLVFISTTSFFTMPLGRKWKSESGVPFVIDLQDPWVDSGDGSRRGIKHAVVDAMHRLLERWTMKEVDGVVAVTPAYNAAVAERYPKIAHFLAEPFAATIDDIAVADRSAFPNSWFDASDGLVHGVFTGALGAPKIGLSRAICEAVRIGLSEDGEYFRRLRLHFIGTSYATDGRASATIAPLAKELGVEQSIHEEPLRVSYFHSIKLLRQADFGILLGSDAKDYLPSKLILYLISGKPVLSIVNRESRAAELLRSDDREHVVTYGSVDDANLARDIYTRLHALLRSRPSPSPSLLAKRHSAEQMTERLAKFFDSVVEHG